MTKQKELTMENPTPCDDCQHCISIPWTDCADGFECLVDVCEKKDGHFKYNLQRPQTACENFIEKPAKK